MAEIENFFNTTDLKRFFLPTRIICGQDARIVLTELVPRDKKGVLVVDKAFERDIFVNSLQNMHKNSIKHVFIVNAEPDTDFISSIIAALSPDLGYVVAVGGGSTIDTAKVIAAQIGYGRWELKDPDYNSSIPAFFALPTTAGTGSEVSRYYLVSDSRTGEKKVCRNWHIAPRYALIDPYFLRDATPRFLILGAFDAFIHLWETFVCHYERSAYNDMISLEGMEKILEATDKIRRREPLSNSILSELQYAATLGGVALSNVRTGIIHDAGEALSAQVRLSHPETLIVFFEAAIEQYRSGIRDREDVLVNRLLSAGKGSRINSLRDIIDNWKLLFEEFGIYKDIQSILRTAKVDTGKITGKIADDKVLITKESPLVLSPEMIRKVIEVSVKKLS